MKQAFPKSEVMKMADKIEYSEGGVISKQVLKSPAGNITLFSFDKGQGLSEHKTPFDALVQVLDGKVEIRIDDKIISLLQGDSVILPANIPHALDAVEKFKMLLTMIK